MTKPAAKAQILVTDDGVPIEAVHVEGDRSLAFVVAHGFTLHWRWPHVWRIASLLSRHGGVAVFDFRGHGRSGGHSTLGDLEIKDLDVVVRYLRELGYEQIVTVGFSMGASIVLRHAGLTGGVDAVISVSGPGRWYYKGTPAMRRVHWAVETKTGRLVAKMFLRTRIKAGRWDPIPLPPAEAAALISPTPLLIVHGDRDLYFPSDHADQLFEAAREPKELWIETGLGHAESAVSGELLDRMAKWALAATTATGSAVALTALPSGHQLVGRGIPSV